MEQDEHKNAVLEELKQCLSGDRRKCNVLGMTSLGLVEFTRNKKRRSLSQYFNKTCPYCKGEGTIRSNDYILMKIRTSLLDIFSKDYNSAIIDLNVDICEYILQTGTLYNDIKKFYVNKRVYLIPHKTYHQEFFLCRGDNNSVLDLPEKAILLH
jgi:ribonuclease G